MCLGLRGAKIEIQVKRKPGRTTRAVQKLKSDGKTMWGKKPGTVNPHKGKGWKREALKQKLAQTEDEPLSTLAKRDRGEKAKRMNIDVD